MSKIYFEIEDDVVIKYTPIPEIGEKTYKTEVVLTKEIFQECYKKWVEKQESNDKCKNCEYYRNPDYTRCHECEAERSDKK